MFLSSTSHPTNSPRITINIEGQTALVTGGGQGLGEQTTRTLHHAGAHVAVTFFEDPQGLNRKKAERLAEELGGRCCALEGDVRDRMAAERVAAEAAARFGGIDILVNNAAILRDRTIAKMSMEEWQAVIDTNLTGVFNMSRACLPHLGAEAKIINMASIAAVVGFFGQANYAAAKAGVIGLTKVLSRELGRKGITVNAIAPGVVLTEMGKSIPEEVRQEMLKQIPLGKFGEPQDIANAVLFLASPLAAYITGQTLHVNGGWIG